MTTPQIAVIIPVYNAEAYLAETLASVVAQDWPNKELWIADDGSSDQSLRIAQDFAGQHNWIQILHHANMGLPKTRNRLWKQTQAPYIATLDADDVYAPGALRSLITPILKRPPAAGHIALAYGNYERLEEGQRTGVRVPFPANPSAWYRLLCVINPILPSASLMQRRLLEQAQGYDENWEIGSEYDFLARIATHVQLYKTEQIVVTYRRHVQQRTHNYSRHRVIRDMRTFQFIQELGFKRLFPEAQTPSDLSTSLQNLGLQILRRSNTPAYASALALLKLANALVPQAELQQNIAYWEQQIQFLLEQKFSRHQQLDIQVNFEEWATQLSIGLNR